MTTTTRGPTARLDQSTAHALLSDERRRAAIAAVAEADGPVSADAIATMLAAREQATAPSELGDDEREAVSRELRHEHLPRLADNAVLAAIPGGFAPGPNFDGLQRIKETTTEYLASSGAESREPAVDTVDPVR